MRPRRSARCVKLLKKFSKLLVHSERADYFPFDNTGPRGAFSHPPLIGQRVAHAGNKLEAVDVLLLRACVVSF